TIRQLDFMNTRDLGYNKDQIITLGNGVGDRYEAFRNELLGNAAIRNVSRSSRIPTGRLLDSQGAQVQKGDSLASTDVTIKNVRVDHDFFNTYEIPFVSGRSSSREIKSDDSLAFILNETAVGMIGWKNDEAVGKIIQYGGTKGQVIGVVKDFHFESLHEPIVPLVFHMSPFYGTLSVAIDGAGMQQG